MKKNYTINISIPAGKFWKVFLPGAIALVCAGALTGIIVTDRWIMPRMVGINRDELPVPDITTLSFEQARQALYDVGLRLHVDAREYSDSVPPEHVISQNPAVGDTIKKGRLIRVTLSRGNQFARVPQVEKLTERQAVIELKKAGIRVGRVNKRYSEKFDEGAVVTVLPSAGTEISRDSLVVLTVSRGPKPTHTVVPNIVGERLTAARTLALDAGITIGQIEYEDHPTLPAGTVVSQSVPPGTRIRLESPLNIVVAASNYR